MFKGDEKEVVSAASKPWLTDRVPMLTSESSKDVCFGTEGSLCVIYLAKDESQKD